MSRSARCSPSGGTTGLAAGDGRQPRLTRRHRPQGLAADLTRAGHGVIFLADEDETEAVVRPRLEAAGANLDRAFTLEATREDEFGGVLLPRDTDERGKVADSFFSPKGKDRILVGKRTGFAFYKDHQLNRKILIGAFEGNMRANNYFDGPFDQLPDNFIEGEALRDAILAVRQQLKGEIDRFGGAPDGSIRFMIGPYMPYRELSDLGPIDACARKKLKRPDYYRCFVSDDESGAMVARKPRKTARPK